MVERSSYPDGEPCWADVSTHDLDATQRFYGAVFGWEFAGSGPEFGNYTMCHRGGKNIAGIGPLPEGAATSPPAWNMYLMSSDVDATTAGIERGGGKLMMGPMDIPGSGRMVFAADPTGASFGVWQPAGHSGSALTSEPGAPCYAELVTRDGTAADAFYRGLFPYEQQQIGDATGDFDYTTWSIGGNMVCGRMQMTDEFPPDIPAAWLVYFAVDDADAAVERVTANGGQVRMGPQDSPYGRMATVADPQGAVFCLIDMERRTEQ
jgi:uncharacterized protein